MIFEICYCATRKTGLVALVQVSGRQPDLPALLELRPHLDFGEFCIRKYVRGGQDYYGLDDRRGAPRVMRVGDSLGASDDCCPCGEILCFYNRSEATIPIDDHRIMGIGGSDPAVAEHQSLGVGRPKNPLPPDASCTLLVEGLPQDCSRREVAHIFRPFIGYKEVRLVTRASENSNADPLVYCFVDYESPRYAANALGCLQGYRFDEQDQDDIRLRLHFAHCPGARSGDEHHGRS